MDDNQEHLAFNHQIGRALSEWQNNIEFGLYNIKQACSGDKRTADTYITLFEERNFRERLAQVNHLVLASFSNTAHHADWLKLHSRIEKAAKGRNALAHHWVLTYPNDKPGRRWWVSRLSASASSASHRSTPCASMSAKSWPSTPGAPLLERHWA
jgi:hypothetical protein